jgi:hypothetical protein
MYERDTGSEAEWFEYREAMQPFGRDYEQARWAAIFTAEDGFFSAACLQRLFLSTDPTRDISRK